MFRQRLGLALACLALASLLQGALAWWAIGSATAQVMRGRVASELLQGYLQLSDSKQRLRSWTSQALLRAGASAAERDVHLREMRATLDALQALAQRAADLEPDPERAQRDWREREETLAILRHSVDELETALRDVRPLPTDADPAATWQAITQVFDTSQGQDLRQRVARTVAREQAAVEREREAADQALTRLAGGVLLATLAIAMMAVGLALYFAAALRRPLEQLGESAQALQRGELGHRMPVRGSDEFSAVARTLNAMAAELQQHHEREVQARHELERQVQARTGELQQALQALQQLDASRRQLFADISHELRTPTTAIRGEAEIALRGRPKSAEDYRETLRRIVETADQLGHVIDDLLAVSRSESQSLRIEPRRVAVAVPVQEALQQVQALAHERGLSLQWHNQADICLQLWCDSARLRQLLVLVLDNAIRYSNAGTQVLIETRTQDGHWLAVVRDQGIGIAAEDLPRVFERHFRSEQARRHRADGVGLGLALAQALTRAHRGTLGIESTPGQGTSVTLRLPLESEESA